jgi:Concanavalin A-like lectin/glucanases superfamily
MGGSALWSLVTPISTLLLLLLLWAPALRADVECDGVDDDLDTGLALSNFLSASTGTYMLWYKPLGTASSNGGAECFPGEFLMGDLGNGGGTFSGLFRNGNLSGTDRLCAWNYDGSVDQIVSTYTTGTWTHLTWQHSGGNLLFYKDGALVSSTASGDTSSLANQVRLCNGLPAGVKVGEGIIAAPQIFPTALSAAEIAVIAGSRLHRVASSVASATWELSACADGASCNTLVFPDRSGNGRVLTASGGTGRGGEFVGYPWGVE